MASASSAEGSGDDGRRLVAGEEVAGQRRRCYHLHHSAGASQQNDFFVFGCVPLRRRLTNDFLFFVFSYELHGFLTNTFF
jgi:hypothetical protein